MLSIDVTTVPCEMPLVEALEQYTAVVIDALRATSTITTAVANGSRHIYPVATLEAAAELKAHLPGAIMGGERKGAKIAGFDCGNSPLEYPVELVHGRDIIFTTSNGTPVLVACALAGSVLVASYLNRKAVARVAATTNRNVLIACAGRGGKLAAEDLACAGAIVAALQSYHNYTLTDGALTAVTLFKSYEAQLKELMTESLSGKNISKLGYSADIAYCSQLDVLEVVPTFSEGRIATCEG